MQEWISLSEDFLTNVELMHVFRQTLTGEDEQGQTTALVSLKLDQWHFISNAFARFGLGTSSTMTPICDGAKKPAISVSAQWSSCEEF